MKINKNKYPILDWPGKNASDLKNLIKVPAMDDAQIDDWLPFVNHLYSNWGRVVETIRDSTFLVSQTFSKASFANAKMFDGMSAYDWIGYLDQKGVLLKGEHSIYYDLSLKGQEYFFVLESDVIIVYAVNTNEGFYHKVRAEMTPADYDGDAYEFEYWFSFLGVTLLFKHYAKVETKVLNPSEKVKDLTTKEKHLNESKYPVTILDCTWFTNIVRNSPFGVRGHFRLQPKKDVLGNWTKELIYIEPFMKKGYNIRAKKTI